MQEGVVDGSCDVEEVAARLSASFPQFARLPRPSKALAARQAMAAAAARMQSTEGEGAADAKEGMAVESASPGKSLGRGEQSAAANSAPKRPRVESRGRSRSASAAVGEERVSFRVLRPPQRYADIGGVASVLQVVRELVELPLMHVELFTHLGVDPPRGILLHGPPGCGKTLLANAIAGELDVPFFRVAAPEMIAGVSGESERRLRQLFQEACTAAPCLVFIDEIDAITAKRESSAREMLHRIVAQLLTCMDSLSLHNTGMRPVIVIGATNRPEALDSALRRAGRFDREIELGAPDEEARLHILQTLSRRLRLDGAFDFQSLAKRTAGYVGADLAALTMEAAAVAVGRIGRGLLSTSPTPLSAAQPLGAEQLHGLSITMDDFVAALSRVQPSALREGFSTVPDVTWADVGALDDLKNELMMTITEPIREPERFAKFGLHAPAGVLLYGPPGCGKTLLAKAVANESGANFISIKGPELLNKYVGESERAVRRLFQRARSSAPCVIFFDELDALAPRRALGNFHGGGGDGSADDVGHAGASERVVNQLLTELDGMDARRHVFVVAATNRPDLIDSAMLRPGRFDKLLYVALPSEAGRQAILRTAMRGTPHGTDVDVPGIAAQTPGFSGADLASLVREAAMQAMRADSDCVRVSHFQDALQKVSPSVSRRDAARYEALQFALRKSRAHVLVDRTLEMDG